LGEMRSLSLSGGNQALAGSMQRILESALAAQQAGVAAGQAPEDSASTEHVFLSAYQSQ